MRRRMLALLAAIIVLFTVPRASARSVIELGASTSKSRVQFLGDGGGNFTLNMCSKVVQGMCVGRRLQGTAQIFVVYHGYYTITGGGVTGTLISPANCDVCRWKLSGHRLYFEMNSNKNGHGIDFLDGTFQLLRMTQTRSANGVGFNQIVLVKFQVLGGALAPYFQGDHGVVKLYVQFTTDKPVQRIPKGRSLFGRFDGTQ